MSGKTVVRILLTTVSIALMTWSLCWLPRLGHGDFVNTVSAGQDKMEVAWSEGCRKQGTPAPLPVTWWNVCAFRRLGDSCVKVRALRPGGDRRRWEQADQVARWLCRYGYRFTCVCVQLSRMALCVCIIHIVQSVAPFTDRLSVSVRECCAHLITIVITYLLHHHGCFSIDVTNLTCNATDTRAQHRVSWKQMWACRICIPSTMSCHADPSERWVRNYPPPLPTQPVSLM